MKRICTVGFLCLSLIAVFSCASKKQPAQFPNKIKMMPLLEKFAPPANIFAIDPSSVNTVTGRRGIRLDIPADSFILPSGFRKGDKINVELVEIMDRFDFITSGVGLDYVNMGGLPMLFESAGMYRVGALYNDKKLELAEGKKITVQMPNLVPGEEFGMYRMNDKWEWEFNGHNQESSGADMPRGEFRRDKKAVEAYRVIKENVVGVRIYAIDKLTWWNCDYPASQIIFIEGIVHNLSADDYCQVMAFSLTARGVFSVFEKGEKFRIRSPQKHLIRIIVLTKDNRAAVSEPFTAIVAQEMKIKDLELKPLDPEIVKDQKKFESFLGLSREKYTVQYKKKIN